MVERIIFGAIAAAIGWAMLSHMVNEPVRACRFPLDKGPCLVIDEDLGY